MADESDKMTRAEWEASMREQWRTAETGLGFDVWRDQLIESQREAHEAEDRARLAQERAEWLQRRADQLVPPRYRDAEPTEPVVARWCDAVLTADRERASNAPLRGPSLLLLGPTGIGKTHQAYGALRRLVLAGLRGPVYASTAVDLYAALRPRRDADSEAVYAEYAKAPLLMLDDLGIPKGSEWTEQTTYRLVNDRYNNVLPTVVTSNMPPRQLAAELGERVASRLTEMCEFAVLKGTDRRHG